MKFALRIFACMCMALSFSANADAQIKGALAKSFDELEKYNYFAAKDGFYKALKKEKVPASYGLSIIYSRFDNPFTNLDSALKFITISRKQYPALDAKLKTKYALSSIDSVNIYRQVRKVDSLAYNETYAAADTSMWSAYLKWHYTSYFLERAATQRDSLAYSIAQEANTAMAYSYFLNSYPAANQHAEAKRLFEKCTYEEWTVSKHVDEYRSYIKNYPNSVHRDEAEFEVFKKYTRSGTPEVYLLFIEENHGNKYLDEAWRNIYASEIGDTSPRAIAAFTLKYPDYPFMEELLQDFNLSATSFYPARKGAKWGYIDENGVMRIEPVYDWCEPFAENFASVGKDDKANFVGKDGRELSTDDFDEVYSFKNGYAVVETDGKVGLVNRLGNWLLAPEYEECGEFSEGFVYASQGGKFGYFNSKGKAVIPFDFDQANDFKFGRAIVQQNGVHGAIDSLGNVVIQFAYNWIEPFNESESSRVRLGKLFGLMNHSGRLITPVQYDALGEYSGGYYLAAKGGKYGFITAQGDTAVPFTFDLDPAALLQSKFINGYAKVYQKDKNIVKVGLIDTLGKKVIPAMFDDLTYSNSDLIPVRKKNQWGYADKALKLVIPYKYDAAGPFADSLAMVSIKGKFGLIDKQGKPALNLVYSYLQLIDSLCLVADTAYGVINRQAEVRVPMRYKSVENIDGKTLLFKGADGSMHYYSIAKQRFIWREEIAEL